ncbi:S8 family serine peptidase, partial [bacterium]|nr:S8 family serine peptidase [bacterium]
GNHGTHVAGSAVGNGAASDGQFRGMACEADIFCLCAGLRSGYIYSGNEDDLVNTYNEGARVMNNSWGSNSDGYYGSGARLYDKVIWDHPDYTICFSSGNGNKKIDLPTQSAIMYDSSAKNIITVGGSENWRPKLATECEPFDGVHQGIADFSARGPCADGRTKPDVIAPATGVYSTLASADKTSTRSQYYTYMGGTSMASPIAAGCAAVVRDYLTNNRHVESPSAALVKCVMCVGARSLFPGQYDRFMEIPPERPNNVEGNGHVNVKESLEPTDGKMSFAEMSFASTGKAVTNYFEKPAGCDLNVGLCWTDYPGNWGSEKALINDLDLYVVEPGGTVHTLNDHLNNIETMRLGDTPAGRYAVIVKAYNIMEGVQPCAVVFSYGKGWKVGNLAFTEEPSFPWKETTCKLSLTNTVPNSYIGYRAEIIDDPEGLFTISKEEGRFSSSETIILTADLTRSNSARPYCKVKINAQSAGCLIRKISLPNGSDEEGYTLYKEDFTQDLFTDLVEEDSALSATGEVDFRMKSVSPNYYDLVKSEDFESYEADESIIGKGGWTVGYGPATNGSSIVRYEIKGGVTNKYLEVKYLTGLYAPHLKVQGIKTKWTEPFAHGYFLISAKVKMSGRGDKTFSFFTPDIAEPVFKRHASGFIVDSDGKDEEGNRFRSMGYLRDDEWTDLEMLIEADSTKVAGANRHILRRLKFAGVEEDCYGVFSKASNDDYFSVLRFFQWGEGEFCIDDIKIERYVSDVPYEKIAIMKNIERTNSSNPDSDGLLAKIGLPAGLQTKFDLQFNVEMSLNDKVSKFVLGQNSSNRQFQSQFVNEGGDFKLELTDLADDPGLIKTEFPTNDFISYGYKINTASGKKVLHRLFINGDNISVEKQLTGSAVKPMASVDSVRMYLPKCTGEAMVKSLEVKLMPLEKASLGVVPRPFRIGETETEWTLTNAAPSEAINFTASIVSGSDLFEVSPESGTFTDSTALTIRCKNGSTTFGKDLGVVKIDAGEAGTITKKFIRPRGNDGRGYLLYSDDFKNSVGEELDVTDSSWSQNEKLSVTVEDDGSSSFLRFGRSKTSTLPNADQGVFIFIGAPEGHSTNLNFHVSCKLRFPEDYAGYFYLTQNEDQRQFQSAFSAINTGGQKMIKLSLTDYTRNTGLFTKNAPRGEWIAYDFELNALPSYKKLEEITFYNTTKVEGYKITGTKVAESDQVDYLRLNLTGSGAYVDVKDLRVTLESPVPEPSLIAIISAFALLLMRKRS